MLSSKEETPPTVMLIVFFFSVSNLFFSPTLKKSIEVEKMVGKAQPADGTHEHF
jgi:hypothetical protein